MAKHTTTTDGDSPSIDATDVGVAGSDRADTNSVPSISGKKCAVREGYFDTPCPNRRTYRGHYNGGAWYECAVCGGGEVGPEPKR